MSRQPIDAIDLEAFVRDAQNELSGLLLSIRLKGSLDNVPTGRRRERAFRLIRLAELIGGFTLEIGHIHGDFDLGGAHRDSVDRPADAGPAAD